MSRPTWAEIEAVFQSTIATASGLATIWGHQSANQPGLDYVRLTLGAAATVGIDFVDERYDSTQPAHQQIVLGVGGVREVPLQIEVWSSALVETANKATALSILDAIVTKLRLPLARTALANVGVTPFDPGPANWLPSIVAVGFRGRANCDVRCRMPARVLQEFTDYIAEVQGTTYITGVTYGEVDLPFDFTL